jgi:hypothetical protein
MQNLNHLNMHHEQPRNIRSRKEDRELIRSIIFFAIIAFVVALLVIKGAV